VSAHLKVNLVDHLLTKKNVFKTKPCQPPTDLIWVKKIVNYRVDLTGMSKKFCSVVGFWISLVAQRDPHFNFNHGKLLNLCHYHKECFFLKFGVEVGVEESIVNEPLVLKTLIFQIAD
jgi:hypothetical protein